MDEKAIADPPDDDEIKITPEMITAGETELAVRCDPFSFVSAVTGVDLKAVYIAM